jgi:SAM-dependent methyltransferase
MEHSWDISELLAKTYLHNYSKNSKIVLSKLIYQKIKNPNILDIGCGNAQIYPILKNKIINLTYTGVDFSKTLTDEAKKICINETIICEDINNYLLNIKKRFDISILCHMLECSESPDFLVSKAVNCSKYIAILWYDYPNYEYDSAYINDNSIVTNKHSPFIRRKISKDYLNMIINKNKLKLVYKFNNTDKDVLEIYTHI